MRPDLWHEFLNALRSDAGAGLVGGLIAGGFLCWLAETIHYRRRER